MNSRSSRKAIAALRVLLLSVIASTMGLASAQSYPQKPVELIVPYAPGGTNDVVARLVAEGLTTELGQPVIILNKPGASASLGSAYVARARPDGHTLLLGSQGSHSANPYLLRNLPYDALKDFSPIALIGKVNNVLVVPKTMPVQSMEEFLAYARKNPGAVNFSHAGVGTSMSLAGELFKLKTGVDMVSIPYQGSAPATLAVVSGEVQSMFANTTSVMQHIQSGKLRPLGVTSGVRDLLLPNVKTIAEQGVAGFDIQSWFGIFAPAQTPQPIVEKLNGAIRKILARPEVMRRFAELGVTEGSMTTAEFRSFVAADNAAVRDLVRRAGLKPE